MADSNNKVVRKWYSMWHKLEKLVIPSFDEDENENLEKLQA